MNETPSKKPTTKVKAAALGGAIATVTMGLLAAFAPEYYDKLKLVPGLEGGIATLAAIALGYFVRERV